jgi:hypothetical protein
MINTFQFVVTFVVTFFEFTNDQSIMDWGIYSRFVLRFVDPTNDEIRPSDFQQNRAYISGHILFLLRSLYGFLY